MSYQFIKIRKKKRMCVCPLRNNSAFHTFTVAATQVVFYKQQLIRVINNNFKNAEAFCRSKLLLIIYF